MRKLILMLSCVLSSTMFFTQDFEGFIKYKIDYYTRDNEYSIEYLEKEFGTKCTFYVKNGFFLDISNGSFGKHQLFRNDQQKLYYYGNNKSRVDTLFYTSSHCDDTIDYTYKIYRQSEVILGIMCDKLIEKSEYSTKTFFYSTEHSLNPDFFKNYTKLNSYERIKLMKSICLKLIYEHYNMDMVLTACKIKEKKLRKSVFQIPKYNVLVEGDPIK